MIGSMLLRAALVAGLVISLVLGYRAWAGHQQRIGEDRATQRYELAIAQQKSKAAHSLAREIQNALDLERRLADQHNKLEREDASNQRTVADLRARLRAAATVADPADAPRLRDPYADAASTRCGRGGDRPEGTATASAESGAGDGAQVGGLLSAQLTGLLERITAEADAVNIAYIACRADAIAVRALTSTKE